jgi:hypothetical protein
MGHHDDGGRGRDHLTGHTTESKRRVAMRLRPREPAVIDIAAAPLGVGQYVLDKAHR